MLPKSAYEVWLENEEVPVYTGYGVKDVAAVPRGQWKRTGGKAAFFDLRGMDGFTAGYVVEIGPHQRLNVQQHMYEESMYGLAGTGILSLLVDNAGERVEISWKEGTLFAPPLNCPYELRNDTDSIALLFVATNMPLVMDLFADSKFIFDCGNRFEDRISEVLVGKTQGTRTSMSGRGGLTISGAQIDNVPTGTDPNDLEGSAEAHGVFALAGNALGGHLAGEPVGKYDEAHYHGGGAIILILKSYGYSLMWPAELGPRPYQDGFADRIVKVEWGPGSIISPPGAWFHQHFNLGNVPARNIAFRFGYGLAHPVRFYLSNHDINGRTACTVGMREGGSLIDFEDEDPKIHADYEMALKASGVPCAMDHQIFSPASISV